MNFNQANKPNFNNVKSTVNYATDMLLSVIKNHPNPYIEVFQKLSASPNARALPPVEIWPEVVKDFL